MPPWLQAIILGVVQGLTEFIPISSSGHLVLVPYLVGWEHPGLAFDVALHLGTAAAVVVYFRRELAAMARGVLFGGANAEERVYRRLALLVVAASVPVAVAGLLLEDLVGEAFEQPLFVAGFLLITAGLLLAGERVRTTRATTAALAPTPARGAGDPCGDRGGEAARTGGDLPLGDDRGDPRGRTLAGMTLRHALVVGGLQVLALLPGVSRSGATIAAGMMAGLTREAATRFSFLLSLPALVGAFALSLPDLGEPSDFSALAIAGGVVASFLSGYAAVSFLVALVSRDRLTPFAGYCIVAAIATVVAYQVIGPPAGG